MGDYKGQRKGWGPFRSHPGPLVFNIGLMVLILLWRPQGLYPVAKR